MVPNDFIGAYNRNSSVRDRKYLNDITHKQSPINLITHDAMFQPLLQSRPLAVAYAASTSHRAMLANDGNGLVLRVGPSAADEKAVSQPISHAVMTGGPLPYDNEFELYGICFHWGKENTRGSEHIINSKSYPMEIQLMHWNRSTYASPDEAQGKCSGIAVAAVLVEIGLENTSLRAIVEKLPEVQYKGQRAVLPSSFSLQTLVPDPELQDYWTYEGSLTTQLCCENVTWIVYRNPVTISHAQLEEFRRAKSHEKQNPVIRGSDDDGFLADNFRSPLSLNNRVVCSSFQF